MRIHLEYRRDHTFESSDEHLNVPVIRVVGKMKILLRQGDFWETVEYVLDTGSPYILIPKYLWRRMWKGKRKRFVIMRPGNPPRNMVGSMSEVKLVLHDNHHETTPMLAKAFLAATDDVPLIVGFNTVLEKFILHSNYAKNVVYIETVE
jgi:hypothetical protein